MQYVDILALKSEFMRVLAHPIRIGIVEILGDKKMSVGEICELLNKEQANQESIMRYAAGGVDVE